MTVKTQKERNHWFQFFATQCLQSKNIGGFIKSISYILFQWVCTGLPTKTSPTTTAPPAGLSWPTGGWNQSLTHWNQGSLRPRLSLVARDARGFQDGLLAHWLPGRLLWQDVVKAVLLLQIQKFQNWDTIGPYNLQGMKHCQNCKCCPVQVGR